MILKSSRAHCGAAVSYGDTESDRGRGLRARLTPNTVTAKTFGNLLLRRGLRVGVTKRLSGPWGLFAMPHRLGSF